MHLMWGDELAEKDVDDDVRVVALEDCEPVESATDERSKAPSGVDWRCDISDVLRKEGI
jgi:hypothetical protein